MRLRRTVGRRDDRPVRVTPPPEGCTCPPQAGWGQERSHIVGNPHCFIDRNYAERLRKIPVLVGSDMSKQIGWLELEPVLSDGELKDCFVSWLWEHKTGKILSVSLVPNLRVSDGRVHGEAAEEARILGQGSDDGGVDNSEGSENVG